MLIASRHARPSRPLSRRPRRGVALVFVMVFVIAMAALAMSSIFMSSGATSLARSYDRERDLRFAAEAGLAIGKARLTGKPALLVMGRDTLYRKLLDDAVILDADSLPLPGIRVNVYLGLTGSTSGQYGRFASIVSQAYDERTHAGFIRRLELTQESFAKFAYWSNQENLGSGSPIYFGHRDVLWGPVWSNDTISILSDSAIFNDEVGTAMMISGKQYGVFRKPPPLENQPRINLPSTAQLGVLPGYASQGGMYITSMTSAVANANAVRDRIEFLAFDVDLNKDSADTDEGFYRLYRADVGNDAALRGDWPGGKKPSGNPSSIPDRTTVDRCGDWHYMPAKNATDTAMKFYPASVHAQPWFVNQIDSALMFRPGKIPPGAGTARQYAVAEGALNLVAILKHAGARCYLAGDPHLVSTDRVSGWPRPLGGNYTDQDVRKGGEDTTFTPRGRFGQWIPSDSVPQLIRTRRPWDGRYLYPIGHAFNPDGKGVIYASGNVGVSGLVNGLVTLYAAGDIVILDDITYVHNPVLGVCQDILGMISNMEVVVADNAINTPVGLSTDSVNMKFDFRSMDEGPDLTLHSVIMALGSSFEVQNYDQGPWDANDCDGTANGRGCIMLSGGVIQQVRGTVGKADGRGFSKRYTYDRCVLRSPPPYFPTTGRFLDNRYLELDPVAFDPKAYFLSLSPKTSP